MIKGIIFDLDGVLTDTSTFHYLAWKKTALEKLGYDFSEADNEAFRGVSRLACMELMERLAGTTLSPTEREAFLNLKTAIILSM